jgi:glutamyl-tRNA synthetase
VAEANRLKLGDVMQPVRVALTGSTVSEPVNELLTVIGPQSSIRTLKATAERLHGGLKPA